MISIKGRPYVVSDTQEECISLCQNTSDCYRWTYATIDKHCQLMRKYSESKTLPGVNSGSRYLCKGN